MNDSVYQKFIKRWDEVTDLPPQTFGPLTPYYKAVTKRLKVMPWPLLIVGALFVVFALYFILGTSVIYLVSLLQRGF